MIRMTYIWIVLLFMSSCGDSALDTHPITRQSDSSLLDTLYFSAGEQRLVELCKLETTPKAFLLQGLQLHTLDHSVIHDCFQITFDSGSTSVAGAYSFDLVSDKGIKLISNIVIEPGAPQHTIPSFIGPKTISFKDERGAMLTVFPVDQYNNPTNKNGVVNFSSISDMSRKTQKKPDSGTYSVYDLNTDGEEKILMGASTENAHTEEHQIRVLTGCPKNIELKIAELFPVADGRQFFKAETSIMRDELGRIIENGTFVVFNTLNDRNQLYSQNQSMVVSGIASTWIKNPTKPGKYTIQASVCGEKSTKIDLELEAIIANLPYTWKENDLTVGPISSVLGQLIADGTLISFITFQNDTKYQLSKELNNGYASFNLSDLWAQDKVNSGNIELYGIPFPVVKSEE